MKIAATASLVALCLLAACGGGGGSSPTPATVGSASTPTSTPTTAPATVTMTGKAVELASGAALTGFTVTVGTAPNTGTCSAAQTASANPCCVPAGTPATATTAADGSFSMTIPAGTSMVTIGKDGTFATLHRTVSSASPALGTVKIAALSAREQAWLVDANSLRTTVSTPASFANLTVDEYAQEQARQWPADVASGRTAFSDAGYAPYQAAYAASAGAMYAAAGVLSIVPQTSAFPVTYGSVASGQGTLASGSPGYQSSDYAWMYGDKSNCTAPYTWNTTACSATFSVDGHYINLSNTLDVWVGLGESAVGDPAAGGQSPYDIMIVQS
jgi:hypothetical protein